MRIIVNHLTRMQKGFMCVAGIEPDTGRHIRPVLDRQMRVEMLACHGGPFELRRVIDLGETTFAGRMPEIEDQLFRVEQVRVESEMDAGSFYELMAAGAANRLAELFGPELVHVGRTCGVPERRGIRSLGCYWANGCCLHLDASEAGSPRVRLTCDSDFGPLRLPVTDIGLFGSDHVTPDASQINLFASRLAPLDRILLSIGLSRAYRRSAEQSPMHWLQVNNLHLPPAILPTTP
ncbi:MAG: hypothetical protein ABI614_02190 [Planctomycetota bacterium]